MYKSIINLLVVVCAISCSQLKSNNLNYLPRRINMTVLNNHTI
jgi:hypothetical protein